MGSAAVVLVSAVLVFADAKWIASPALVVLVCALPALGFAVGRPAAILLCFLVVLAALLADLLWLSGWPPLDRGDEWEPVAQTPFVILGLPLPAGLIGLGVALRARSLPSIAVVLVLLGVSAAAIGALVLAP